MKLKMLPLILSSAALAASVHAAESTVELNIKLSNFSENQDKHCLYSNVFSIQQQAVACSDNDQFVLNGDLAIDQSYVASIQVKNEVTQEWIVNGSLVLNVNADGQIQIEHENGMDALKNYQFDNNLEYYLGGQTGVEIFDGENLTGKSITLFEEIADLGSFNEKMHSYILPDTWTVRFYEGKNFTGGYYTRGVQLHGSFDEMDFEPRIQSMRIISKGE